MNGFASSLQRCQKTLNQFIILTLVREYDCKQYMYAIFQKAYKIKQRLIFKVAIIRHSFSKAKLKTLPVALGWFQPATSLGGCGCVLSTHPRQVYRTMWYTWKYTTLVCPWLNSGALSVLTCTLLPLWLQRRMSPICGDFVVTSKYKCKAFADLGS